MPPPSKPLLDGKDGIVGRKSLQIARPVQRAIYQDEYMVSCFAETLGRLLSISLRDLEC